MRGRIRSLSRQLEKQMPGKHRQDEIQPCLQTSGKTSPSQLPSPPTALPTLSQLTSADQTLVLPFSPYPGVTAELPAHPFPSPAACCWEHPAASSQLQHCLSAAACASLLKRPQPTSPACDIRMGSGVSLLTARPSPHFHPSGRGTAACGGHMLQGHSRWDAPPPAAVKD